MKEESLNFQHVTLEMVVANPLLKKTTPKSSTLYENPLNNPFFGILLCRVLVLFIGRNQPLVIVQCLAHGHKLSTLL